MWACRMPTGPVGCGLWKGICRNLGDFFKHIKFKVNKGDRVKFWLEAWCSREPLCDLFSSCFSLAQSKYGSVAEHMIRSRVFCSWDLKPKRNLNDWEIEEMGRLLDVLNSYTVGDLELEDEMIWIQDEEGGFSVKSMYENLCLQKPESSPSICA